MSLQIVHRITLSEPKEVADCPDSSRIFPNKIVRNTCFLHALLHHGFEDRHTTRNAPRDRIIQQPRESAGEELKISR